MNIIYQEDIMYRKGQTVRILNGSKIPNYTCAWEPYMNKFEGQIFTIEGCMPFPRDRHGYFMHELQGSPDADYIFDERGLEPVTETELGSENQPSLISYQKAVDVLSSYSSVNSPAWNNTEERRTILNFAIRSILQIQELRRYLSSTLSGENLYKASL